MNSRESMSQQGGQFNQVQSSSGNGQFLDHDTINIRYYWRLLLKYKFSIAGISLISGVVTALVMLGKVDVYESTATLMIESQRPNIPTIEQLYGLETGNRDYLVTQVRLMRSRNLLDQAVIKLGLVNHPEYALGENENTSFDRIKTKLLSYAGIETDNASLPATNQAQDIDDFNEFESIAPDQLARLRNAFNRRLTIDIVPNTQLLNISYQSSDPRLAAEAANTFADVYIESYLDQQVDSTQKATSWMNDQLASYKISLDASERSMQDFLEREQLVEIEGVATLNLQELDNLNAQAIAAQREKAEAESLYNLLNSLDNPSPEELLALPAVLNYTAIAKARDEFIDLQQEKAELSNRYGRNHPDMIALNTQLNEAQGNLNNQLNQVVATIEAEYRAAIEKERVTQARLEDSKRRYQDVNRANSEYSRLEREVETNRQMYDMFFTRLRETDGTENFQSTNAVVVDPAISAMFPSMPDRKRAVQIALLAGLMLGASLAFLRDFLDNAIHSPADIEERLRTTTLGVVPYAKEAKVYKDDKKKRAYMGFMDDKHSSFSESFRTMRTGLMLSSLDEPFKLIAVTSSVPNEGKSTVSINLAAVLGQMHRTLLIDTDMRRPSLAKSLGLAPGSPGLSNLIAGTSESKECIYYFKEGGFAVIPGGQKVSNPLELISSPKFKQLLTKLGENFDQIILDTPPTQTVSDALVISSFTDATVYVVKADSTPISVIKAGLARLRQVGANIVGVTLNQVDVTKKSSYYYYGGYYDTYGYSKTDKSDSEEVLN